MTYLIGDAGFVGDMLFMSDYGTARCDFPGGDARKLFQSIQKLFELPDDTRLFMCHDYKAPGRDDYGAGGSPVQVPVQVPTAPVEGVGITGRTRRRTGQSNSRITIEWFSAIKTAGQAKGANPIKLALGVQ